MFNCCGYHITFTYKKEERTTKADGTPFKDGHKSKFTTTCWIDGQEMGHAYCSVEDKLNRRVGREHALADALSLYSSKGINQEIKKRHKEIGQAAYRRRVARKKLNVEIKRLIAKGGREIIVGWPPYKEPEPVRSADYLTGGGKSSIKSTDDEHHYQINRQLVRHVAPVDKRTAHIGAPEHLTDTVSAQPVILIDQTDEPDVNQRGAWIKWYRGKTRVDHKTADGWWKGRQFAMSQQPPWSDRDAWIHWYADFGVIGQRAGFDAGAAEHKRRFGKHYMGYPGKPNELSLRLERRKEKQYLKNAATGFDDVSAAVKTLTEALAGDEELYQGYKDNIAAAFIDEYKKGIPHGYRVTIYTKASNAADRFLKNWIGQVVSSNRRKKLKEDVSHLPTDAKFDDCIAVEDEQDPYIGKEPMIQDKLDWISWYQRMHNVSVETATLAWADKIRTILEGQDQYDGLP